MKRVILHTLGCKLNYTETSTIGRQFAERGFTLVGQGEQADIVVLNTCSVTERADRECRQIIRRELRRSPGAFVIVTGCYAQLQPSEIAAIDGVDLVIGSAEKLRIFDIAGEFAKHPLPQVFVSCIDEADTCDPSEAAEQGDRTRAFLKIQDGCDFSCTFCTIPKARGASRSLPAEDVVARASAIAARGFREIVLTGVNVGDYGRSAGTGLLSLIRALDQDVPVDRFRISSIEPNLLTPPVIALLTGGSRFCNHFHIPLQSGCDDVLRRMRRRYSTAQYRTLIESVRAADSDAGIGADVIVGFPGETDAAFETTRRFVESLPLSYLHVFTYSERPGTPAAGYDGEVEPRIRAQRSEILRRLGEEKRRTFAAGFQGRILPVLFESAARNGFATGLTRNYLRVEIPSLQPLENQILPVRILGAGSGVCTGEPAAQTGTTGIPDHPTTIHGQHHEIRFPSPRTVTGRITDEGAAA